MDLNIVGYNTTGELVQAVDTLRTILGTMVIVPNEETNPDTFKKVVVGSVQRPIIENEQRKLVTDKLIELVKQL